MKRNGLILMSALLSLTVLSACGSEQQQSAQVNYNEVKTMVVDILKTEDGQKAIDEAMNKTDNKMFSQMQILQTGQGQQLQLAVKEVMSDPAYAHALKDLMVDPKFAGDFAKAISTENKEMTKALMKDPEYQQALIDILKDPQFEQILLETMKSSQYRQQIMTVMNETMEIPMFQQKWLKLIEKALEEQAKPKPDDQKVKQQGGGKEGGSDDKAKEKEKEEE